MPTSRQDGGRDLFEEAYTEGIFEELPEAPAPRSHGRAAPEAASAPGVAWALKGCVLTPDIAIEKGFVEILADRIVRVGTATPAAGTPIVDTEGVILPGLIDLHGHPEFNIFAAWEPPKLYANRGRWRDSKEYAALVRGPMNKLKAVAGMGPVLTRYAEARALVGGVTAIQGGSARYAAKEESLVRNVDLRIFGAHKARAIIDLDDRQRDRYPLLRKQIDDGKVAALYVHLAEGVDDTSQRELARLEGYNLLTAATVIIHGTALTPDQLRDVRDAGAKLVWSPQSNLRLYGQTTNVAAAIDLGIPLGLGADWLPSGSPSLLAELKIARRTLVRQGVPDDPRRLVQMVTSTAATIAGLPDHLGRIAVDRPADLLVLERHHDDPWENVLAADPAWVELVTIGGDLAYGREAWIRTVADPGAIGALEPVLAWGKPMVVDTSYSVLKTASSAPRLADLRKRLIESHPGVGPIFT